MNSNAHPAPSDPPEPRRIAHLHSSLGVYGAERWTLTLLRYLDRTRNESLVLSFGNKSGADLFCREALAQGHAAEHLALPGKFSARVISGLREILMRHRIEILHSHGFKSDVIGYLATLGTDILRVSTVHGWSAHEGPRIRFYEALSRLFLRRYDRVYPLSPQLLEGLRRSGLREERLRLILNAVDVDAFEAVFSARRTRGADEPARVVFIGRLCHPKGVVELVQGFARARLQVPSELILVGEGPERAELELLVADLSLKGRVVFAGALPPEGVLRTLQGADLLVLASHSEGIPRVLMEAFSAGVPCIGTSIPGVMQLIGHEQTGLLVPVSDPGAIACAIERLVADPEFGRALAQRARARVSESFSARRQALEFDAEYRQLVRR